MKSKFPLFWIFYPLLLISSCTNYVSGDLNGASVDDVRSSIYLHGSILNLNVYTIILTETEDACEDIRDDNDIDAREYSLLALYLGDDHEGDYTVFDPYEVWAEDLTDSACAYFKDVVNGETVIEEWAEIGSIHISNSEYEVSLEGDFEVFFSGNYRLEGRFRAVYCETR